MALPHKCTGMNSWGATSSSDVKFYFARKVDQRDRILELVWGPTQSRARERGATAGEAATVHCNCVSRLHAHAKRLSPPGVPLFGLACGHGTNTALRVIIAILVCKTGCVAASRVSAVLPYVVSTVVGSAGRRPSPISANLLAWQKHTTGRAPITNEPRRPPPPNSAQQNLRAAGAHAACLHTPYAQCDD